MHTAGSINPQSPLASGPTPLERLQDTLASLAVELRGDDGGPYDRVLTRLALASVWSMVMNSPLRLALLGQTGAGKTTLAKALARALGVPFAHLLLTDLAENTWAGPQVLTDGLAPIVDPYLRAMAGAAGLASPPTEILAPHGVVLLDELQSLALTTAAGTRHASKSSGASWRVGRQESLLPLLDENGVMLGSRGNSTHPIRVATHRLLVISAGSFGQLDHTSTITPAALVQTGLLPELVDRMGPILQLPPLHPAARAMRLEAADERLDRFRRLLGLTQPLDPVSLPPAETFAGPRGAAHARVLAGVDSLAAALLANRSGLHSTGDIEP